MPRHQKNLGSGSGSGVTAVGTIDSNGASSDALSISSTTIYAQSASASNAGAVNTTTQTFTGVKTFNLGIDVNSHKITHVLDPASAQDAATKNYVDTVAAGINPAVAVQAATTSASNTSGYTYNNGASGVGATLTGVANTALTVDGYTFTAVGQRLLVKNDTQSPSGAFNGIYSVTQLQTGVLPLILTRATDYNQPSDINNTGAIPVINGTLNGTTTWVETAQVTTVGTDSLSFTKYTRNPADYLLVANNLSDVASAATARRASGLNIESLTSVNNANYTVLSTDRVVAITSITGALVLTLCAANAVNPGQVLKILDLSGNVSSTNTVTVNATGSDTANGVTGALTPSLSSDYFHLRIVSDGVSKWQYLNPINLQVFTGNGTWNKPPSASMVNLVMISGGGGGGSGRRSTSGSLAAGGGGGGSGSYYSNMISAMSLTSSVTVTVAASASGGAVQTVDSSNGISGTAGNSSIFGSITLLGGGAGGGGFASSGAGGSAHFGGQAGGSAPGGGAAGVAASTVGAFTGAGGSGGGVSTVPAASSGGAGGQSTTNASGGNAGTSGGDGGGGGSGNSTTLGGGGGGGGASATAAAAGKGGDGGTYGGGGGGGGASLNSNNSGAGGTGAQGIVIVSSW